MSLFWMVTSSTHQYANVAGVSAKPLYESVVWVSDYKSQAIVGVIIYPYPNLKLFLISDAQYFVHCDMFCSISVATKV